VGKLGAMGRKRKSSTSKKSSTSREDRTSSTIRTTKKREFASVSQVLKSFDPVKDKYISREFQKFGYDLAVQLDDMKHKALYIKLAKTTPRVFLEQARNFVKDSQARSKARLFMWKLKELKKENEKKEDKEKKKRKI